MSAFEFKREDERIQNIGENAEAKPDKVKQECVISNKVYDSCRQPNCKLLHLHLKPLHPLNDFNKAHRS